MNKGADFWNLWLQAGEVTSYRCMKKVRVKIDKQTDTERTREDEATLDDE